MSFFRRPDYQSDTTQFINKLKEQKPELEAQQLQFLAQAALVGPELEPPPGVVQALQKLALHGLVDVETATRH